MSVSFRLQKKYFILMSFSKAVFFFKNVVITTRNSRARLGQLQVHFLENIHV
jgi:hypothetical protein